MIGIYKLTCRVNGKSYIGQSKDIRRRMWEHKSRNSMAMSELKKDINTFGFDSFDKEILEECSIDELDEREQFYIKKLKPEYNVSKGGKGPLGYHCTEANKEKLREYGKKQWASKTEEEKTLIITHNLKRPPKGHPVSLKTREKLRNANLGKRLSQETIEKIRASLKGKPRTNAKHRKKVIAVEISTVFASVKDAAAFVGVKPTRISAVLKGRRKTCAGYHWEYYCSSVETSRDECNGVGGKMSCPSKCTTSEREKR